MKSDILQKIRRFTSFLGRQVGSHRGTMARILSISDFFGSFSGIFLIFLTSSSSSLTFWDFACFWPKKL
jgi:hypothetical protein